ncbi:hypothetical protein ACFQ1S_12805 [Kibdelosporangium lantanae]|uniref:Uncharacterized protein n=1 Tax=Kibdelosporangium lantanae TaxID=1497396 RepID=A0ABW3M8Y2_9PSEU
MALKWGKRAVLVAAVVPLIYATTRVAWVLGIPLGIPASFYDENVDSGMFLGGFAIALMAIGGAVLTLGLVQRWGEYYPRWVWFKKGRRVAPAVAIVPATLVSVILVPAGIMEIRMAFIRGVNPDEWATLVQQWTAKVPLPEPTLNLLAWQTIVGAWPISVERLQQYLEKASREAKIMTSWTDRNEEFDTAVSAWPAQVLDELSGEIADFVSRIEGAGWANSLGQKLVQLTMPGVPDVYQGTELWDFSLVDPDNRRLPDFELRREILAEIEESAPPIDSTGAAKMRVVSQALRLRWERPELFTGYAPVHASGPAASHVVSFARGDGDMVVVATRLPVGLRESGGWRDTSLPLEGEWRDVLTDQLLYSFELEDVLAQYPVALLVRSGEE